MAASLVTTADTDVTEGHVNGIPAGLFKHTLTFTDGSPVAGITAQSVGNYAGALAAVRVLFSAVTAPSALTITILDNEGNTLLSESLSGSGELTIDRPILFTEGLVFTISGNTTVSAIATISILFM